MSQPRVDNQTDFIVHPQLLCDRDGERLCVIVKATFEHAPGPARGPDGTFTLAPEQRRRGIRSADIPWGDPAKSAVRYPTDLCLRKPGTDVIVVAIAHAPNGTPVPSFEAGAQLGRMQKIVRITGLRLWVNEGDALTEPRPLTSLAVRYDYAFGGSDDSDETRFVEDPRNPVGRGIAAELASLDRRPAPQIEDPTSPIRSARSKPKPAGLGAIGRAWEPRRSLWGTYDAKWTDERAPLLPSDFDDRANLAATPELVSSTPLIGGEEGALTNLTLGGGSLGFVLPRIRLALRFRVPGREDESFRPPIDTVVLDTVALPESEGTSTARPTPLVLELVWRASVRAPRFVAETEVIVEEVRR